MTAAPTPTSTMTVTQASTSSTNSGPVPAASVGTGAPAAAPGKDDPPAWFSDFMTAVKPPPPEAPAAKPSPQAPPGEPPWLTHVLEKLATKAHGYEHHFSGPRYGRQVGVPPRFNTVTKVTFDGKGNFNTFINDLRRVLRNSWVTEDWIKRECFIHQLEGDAKDFLGRLEQAWGTDMPFETIVERFRTHYQCSGDVHDRLQDFNDTPEMKEEESARVFCNRMARVWGNMFSPAEQAEHYHRLGAAVLQGLLPRLKVYATSMAMGGNIDQVQAAAEATERFLQQGQRRRPLGTKVKSEGDLTSGGGDLDLTGLRFGKKGVRFESNQAMILPVTPPKVKGPYAPIMRQEPKPTLAASVAMPVASIAMAAPTHTSSCMDLQEAAGSGNPGLAEFLRQLQGVPVTQIQAWFAACQANSASQAAAQQAGTAQAPLASLATPTPGIATTSPGGTYRISKGRGQSPGSKGRQQLCYACGSPDHIRSQCQATPAERDRYRRHTGRHFMQQGQDQAQQNYLVTHAAEMQPAPPITNAATVDNQESAQKVLYWSDEDEDELADRTLMEDFTCEDQYNKYLHAAGGLDSAQMEALFHTTATPEEQEACDERSRIGLEFRSNQATKEARKMLVKQSKATAHNPVEVPLTPEDRCSRMFINLIVEGTRIKGLVDTGSMVTFIDTKMYSKYFSKYPYRHTAHEVHTFHGQSVNVVGEVTLPISLGGTIVKDHVVYLSNRLGYPAVIGDDLMQPMRMGVQYHPHRQMTAEGVPVPTWTFDTLRGDFRDSAETEPEFPKVCEEATLQPRCLNVVSVKVDTRQYREGDVIMMEPNRRYAHRADIMIARGLSHVENGQVQVPIINTTQRPMRIPEGVQPCRFTKNVEVLSPQRAAQSVKEGPLPSTLGEALGMESPTSSVEDLNLDPPLDWPDGTGHPSSFCPPGAAAAINAKDARDLGSTEALGGSGAPSEADDFNAALDIAWAEDYRPEQLEAVGEGPAHLEPITARDQSVATTSGNPAREYIDPQRRDPAVNDERVAALKARILEELAVCGELPELANGVTMKGAVGTEEEQRALHLLLLEYEDLFIEGPEQLHEKALGKALCINTGDHPPIRQRLFRRPHNVTAEIRRQTEDYLRWGLIERSESPWASQVVMAKKKDGTMRFCVDFRRLNAITKKDAYPLPLIGETLDALGDAGIFSTMDALSGYWQVSVSKEDQEKTAFITDQGHYQWKRMPFGLTNAPATFQRMMQCVLSGLTNDCCLCFIDDIIVYSRNFWQHMYDLTCVWNRVREAGLQLKGKKCMFLREELAFLGHVISKDGVKTDPATVAKMVNCPAPKKRQEIKRFLGLTGYYRRFVMNYVHIAAPLFEALKRCNGNPKMPWREVWTPDCDTAFEALKRAMSHAPVLAYPDLQKPFYFLFTDASKFGVGSILCQEDSAGNKKVIAYGGHKFTPSQVSYSTTEKECLAIVKGFQTYRPYLLGSQTTVYTDHQALTYILNGRRAMDQLPGRLFRWAIGLQEYEFKVEYKPGEKMQHVDALSRPPFLDVTYQDEIDARSEKAFDVSDSVAHGAVTRSSARRQRAAVPAVEISVPPSDTDSTVSGVAGSSTTSKSSTSKRPQVLLHWD